MTGLQISPDLTLPLDFVTKTCAILAQRRKGKTYTAAVLAEELVAADLPWVALDPTGAWWGLLADANSVDPGLPVVVLGGQHGQLPLDSGAGAFVADLVLEHPGYYVLDLSLLGTKTAERHFAYAFADRLYRRKMHAGMDFPLHLFVDEADMFVPQERDQGDNLMLGAFQSIVRRGGLHGLGTTLISQRPALVNKNVLTQLDMLILLRLVAGNDQDYIDKNYVKRAGTAEQRDALMTSMASLALGEAWVWEPGAEPPLFQRVQIRARRTFNSSATPKPGETRVEPRALADVDLAAIKEAMAETIERAAADDPKQLRKRIADLTREMSRLDDELTREKSRIAEPTEIRVDVPVLHTETIDQIRSALGPALNLMAVAEKAFAAHQLWLDGQETPRGRQDLPRTRPASDRPRPLERPRTQERPDPAPRRQPSRPTIQGTAAPTDIGKGERIVLTAVAQYNSGIAREALTVITGYKRSTRDAYVQRLSQAGLVEAPKGGLVTVTDEGISILGDDFEPLPTGSALRAHWLAPGTLPEGERLILAHLIDAYPDGRDRDYLSEATGYKRSTRDAYLQRLRARQLVTNDTTPRAADTLFDEGGR
jgi:hypothetical protein